MPNTLLIRNARVVTMDPARRVMDEGFVVESGSPDQVLAHPRRERTQAFLSKVL